MRHVVRRLRDDESGISLVETLVVMLLSALMMAAAGSMFVTVAKQTAAAEDVRRSTADASNIMNVVSTSVRASIQNPVKDAPPAAAIVEAGPRSLTIISYTDAGPRFETPLRLQYLVDSAGRMIENRWNPTVTGGYAVFPSMTTAPTASRVLGNVVVNSASEPLFRYFDVSGDAVLPGSTGRLSDTNRDRVVAVLFTVKVRADGSDEIVELHSRIGMPNLNLGADEE